MYDIKGGTDTTTKILCRRLICRDLTFCGKENLCQTMQPCTEHCSNQQQKQLRYYNRHNKKRRRCTFQHLNPKLEFLVTRRKRTRIKSNSRYLIESCPNRAALISFTFSTSYGDGVLKQGVILLKRLATSFTLN